MIYGRYVIFPDFKRIDRKLHEKIGYPASGQRLWSTWWGIICYYILLIIHFFPLGAIIYALSGLAS